MPNFESEGAAGFNALQAFLMKRAAEERQAQLDAQAQQERVLAQEQRAQQAKRADSELALRQQQEARLGQERSDAASALEGERDFRRASTLADTMVPGVLDEGAAETLRKNGYGGLVKQGQPTQGAFQGEDETGVPQYDVLPGVLETSGGFRWQQARQQEQARQEQAQAAQAAAADRAGLDRNAANERAAEANATRESIAGLAAGGRADTTALRNQMTELQIQGLKDKQDAAKTAEAEGANSVTRYRSQLQEVLRDLIDEQGNLKPDVAAVVGPLDSRTTTVLPGSAHAEAQINRLISLLDLNTLNELKRQSKTGATGFGSLAAPELNILESGGSTLRNRGVGEGDYAKELRRIRDAANGTTAKPAGGGGRVYYDANGNPVTR